VSYQSALRKFKPGEATGDHLWLNFVLIGLIGLLGVAVMFMVRG